MKIPELIKHYREQKKLPEYSAAHLTEKIINQLPKYVIHNTNQLSFTITRELETPIFSTRKTIDTATRIQREAQDLVDIVETIKVTLNNEQTQSLLDQVNAYAAQISERAHRKIVAGRERVQADLEKSTNNQLGKGYAL